MPHKTTSPSSQQQHKAKAQRARRHLAGTALPRDDSDDELGHDDEPWEWILEDAVGDISKKDIEDAENLPAGGRKSRAARNASKPQKGRIVGARMGKFECKIGDCVLLKADNNQVWVGIISSFSEEDEMGATVMCKTNASLLSADSEQDRVSF